MPYYQVTGKHEVLGHEPGEVFEATLADGQRLLVGVGHLTEVAAPVAEPVVSEDAPDAPPVPDQTEEV